ncbi:MAG: hypothetical protein IPK74_39680 [Deltaproteobacteria bacterium]|nr:hypothetical protein [Deltaproteobacteria bacterium]
MGSRLRVDSTVEMCLSNYFDELLDPCRDVALNRTRCYPEQVCGDDAIAACRDVSNPFSVCSADPQSWAAAGCDASKCPGECCRGEEPCQGVDANCPWYKPVCNDQNRPLHGGSVAANHATEAGERSDLVFAHGRAQVDRLVAVIAVGARLDTLAQESITRPRRCDPPTRR